MNKVHPSFLAVVLVLSIAAYVLYMRGAENYIESETAAYEAAQGEIQDMPDFDF